MDEPFHVIHWRCVVYMVMTLGLAALGYRLRVHRLLSV